MAAQRQSRQEWRLLLLNNGRFVPGLFVSALLPEREWLWAPWQRLSAASPGRVPNAPGH